MPFTSCFPVAISWPMKLYLTDLFSLMNQSQIQISQRNHTIQTYLQMSQILRMHRPSNLK